MNTPLLLITTVADEADARRLASGLLAAGLVACVNILAPCRSLYHWQGKLAEATEYPLLLKSTQARYDEVEAWLRSHHPYELPELIAVSVEHGLPAYLDWIRSETLPASPPLPG